MSRFVRATKIYHEGLGTLLGIEEEDRREAGWLPGLVLTLLVAHLVLLVYAASQGAERFDVAAVALTASGACLLVGGLIGFLFGIPRTLGLPEGDKDTGHKTLHHANTNLEQISDWLTKVLVGIGLVQAEELLELARELAEELGQGLGGGDHARPLAVSILVAFTTCGFFIGFLWTRLFLARAMRSADVESLEKRIEELGRTNAQLDQINAMAMALTQKHLGAGGPLGDGELAELVQSIGDASSSVKVDVFRQAQDLQARGDDVQPEQIERTIPVLQALCRPDKSLRFHKHFGLLGFALMSQRVPDWDAAMESLDTAIQIRGEQPDDTTYEFHRAKCRIHLDGLSGSGKSDMSVQKEILADLNVVASSGQEDRLQDDVVTNWLKVNGRGEGSSVRDGC